MRISDCGLRIADCTNSDLRPPTSPPFQAGSLVAAHTDRRIGRAIQRFQRKRFGATEGSQYNHVGILGQRNVVWSNGEIEPVWGVWQSDFPCVDWMPWGQWIAEWVYSKNCHASIWELPDLSAGMRLTIEADAASERYQSYDVRRLLLLGRVYEWWNPWRGYAEFLLATHPQTEDSWTCSGFVAWIHRHVLADPPWERADDVPPAVFIDCGRWRRAWDSRG